MNFIKAYKYPLSITLALIAVFFIFQNGTCSNSGTTISTKGSVTAPTATPSSALTISPASSSVSLNGTIQLSVSGGTPPYSSFVVLSPSNAGYFLQNAPGVSSSLATYSAPNYATNVQVGIQDANSNTAYAMITVTSATPTPTPSGGGTSSGTNFKFVQATALNYFDGNWVPSNVIDASRTTCYASAMYSIPNPSTSPYLLLTLGDANTGATGAFYTVDHLYLTARLSGSTTGSGNGSKIAFPLSYTIKARNTNGSGWTTLGTFNTQPDFDAVARVTFTPTVTDQISVIATYMTLDDTGHYYFELCDISK